MLLVLCLTAASSARASCPYFTGPQDVSNIINYLNQLVNCINGGTFANVGSLISPNTWLALNNFVGGLQVNGVTVRTPINASFTLYVNNVSGDDSNPGTSSGAPLLHEQTAVNKVCNEYIMDVGAQVTIRKMNTGVDYTENITLCKYVTSNSWQGTGTFPSNDGYTYPIISGDPGSPSTVVSHPASGAIYTGVDVSTPWIIAYQKLTLAGNVDSNALIISDANSVLYGLGLDYGAVNSNSQHVNVEFGGFFEDLAGPFTISGGGATHVASTMGGMYICQGNAVTISGTPTFTQFINAGRQSRQWHNACTYTGAITGHAYRLDGTAFIEMPGSGSLPGTLPDGIGGGSIYQGVFAPTAYLDRRCLAQDADFVIPNSCVNVQLAVALTNDRTWTLPAATTYPPGQTLVLNASTTTALNGHKITIAFTGSDSFIGGPSSPTLTRGGQAFILAGGGGTGAVGFWQVNGLSFALSFNKTATYDLTTATGTQALTGFGFKPSSCTFAGAVSGTAIGNYETVSGRSDSVPNQYAMYLEGGNVVTSTSAVMVAGSAAGTQQSAVLTSYDSDGLTLTWTKAGAPSGTFAYSALCTK